MSPRVSAVWSRTGRVFRLHSARHSEVRDLVLPLYLWCIVVGEGSDRTRVDVIPGGGLLPATAGATVKVRKSSCTRSPA